MDGQRATVRVGLQWGEGGDRWQGPSRQGGRGWRRQDLAGIEKDMWVLLSRDGLPQFRFTESVLYQQLKTVRGSPEGWD